MGKAKFKVDDWAYIKGTEKRMKLHITEVITQECTGGCQVWYKGRAFLRDKEIHWLPGSTKLNKAFEDFAEIELEEE